LSADEHETDVSGALGGGVDAALAAALAGAGGDKADAVLAEHLRMLRAQTQLLKLQTADLQKDERLRHRAMRVRHANEILKLTFGLAATIVALTVVGFFSLMVWQASRARGLVVESLRAPADLTAQGLDGTAISGRLLDRLNAFVVQSNIASFSVADDISGSWGDDTKVEIPETGVSLGELQRELRHWLGHETHISGQLWRSGGELALAIRSDNGASFTGHAPEAELDKLLDQAALSIFAQTQPIPYVNLYTLDDPKKAEAFLRSYLPKASGLDALIAKAYLCLTLGVEGRNREALPICDKSISDLPQWSLVYAGRENANLALGRSEPTIDDLTVQLRGFESGRTGELSSPGEVALNLNTRLWFDELVGDFLQASALAGQQESEQTWNLDEIGWAETASDLASDHDVNAARAILAKHQSVTSANLISKILFLDFSLFPRVNIDVETGDWADAVHELTAADAAGLKAGNVDDARHSYVWPWLAYALAKYGNIAAAKGLIAATPQDCTRCLQMRGRIAEIESDLKTATYWYDRAVKNAPSSPFAATDWGAMLLRYGDLDGAIDKFTLANQKGPHFADPLEMWGEALIQRNRSDLALAKFEEAAKYAPNWGRLHLKWGEALWWSGNKDEAKKQYAIASGLDLSAAERSEPAKARAHG
jgi:tetratricopeptide (TPR) repeat protein